MTTTRNLLKESVHTATLTKRMVQGAAIGLVLIALFLSGVKNTNPEWGKFWMIRPILVVPIAGAGAGLFYYFADYLRARGKWKKIVANVISLVALIIALWLGMVLGLAGTLWN